MPPGNAFAEIALTLLAAAVVGAVGTWLRQPLIVSFIAVGILVGPAGIGLVTQHEEIELLASIGISLLLFVVGLKLDFQTIRTLGPVALATGVGQIVVTSVVGFLIAVAMGMDTLTATYVAVALTFSSTIIIVKLLSDKHEIDALHGRIAVGFLIVQDLCVILVMIGITAIGGERSADQSLMAHAATILVKGLGFLALVAVLAVRVLPATTTLLARSPELLVLAGIAWAVVLAAVGEVLGLSKEVGAFLAGASLASTPYREAIGSRLVTVRDFLLLFFFIDLGARLDLSILGATLGAATLFSAYVLIGNPIIMMAIMGMMGYRKRTAFLAGLTVAQISEFSLILAALGVSVGHLGPEAMGLITTVGLITIALSTYMIMYSARLYEWLAPWLGIFERRTPFREAGANTGAPQKADVVVLGLGRYGGGIVRHLLLRHRRVIGVDFDPEALARWRKEGVSVVYGDASDPELFDHLPLAEVNWVVSTAPDIETSRVLLQHLRERGYTGKIAVACRSADEGDVLRLQGADVLLRPVRGRRRAGRGRHHDGDGPAERHRHRGARPARGAAGLDVEMGRASHRRDPSARRVRCNRSGGESRRAQLLQSRARRFSCFPEIGCSCQASPRRSTGPSTTSPWPTTRDNNHERSSSPSKKCGWHPFQAGPDEASRTWISPHGFGVTVLAVARDLEQLAAPDPQRPLSEQDRLVLAGTPEDLQRVRTAGVSADESQPARP